MATRPAAVITRPDQHVAYHCPGGPSGSVARLRLPAGSAAGRGRRIEELRWPYGHGHGESGTDVMEPGSEPQRLGQGIISVLLDDGNIILCFWTRIDMHAYLKRKMCHVSECVIRLDWEKGMSCRMDRGRYHPFGIGGGCLLSIPLNCRMLCYVLPLIR